MVGVIEVCDLHKSYQGWRWGRRNHVHALRGVSLSAGAGEVFGLLGPNGAGKTTLIKTLLGIISPTSGQATLFGQPLGSQSARRRVGYLPESLRIDRHHTARTALQYYGRLSRMDAAAIGRRSDELLELVGLRDRDRESVRRFSKGMYQRLGLAQALMHDPDLLILDEPTDGLDPVGRNDVRKVIEQLRQMGKTIFLNSHILQEVELVCSRVAIMVQGQIRAMGPIDSLPAQLGNHDPSQLSTRIDCLLPTDWDRTGWSDIFGDRPLDHEPIPGWNSSHAAEASDSGPAGPPTANGSPSVGNGEAVRITVSLPDQDAIDHVVDQIRDRGISIRSLAVRRPSLEDMFIQLVDESNSDAPSLPSPR